VGPAEVGVSGQAIRKFESEVPMPEEAVDQVIPFEELREQFEKGQSDEFRAFVNQQRAELRAFQQRQLERKLKFLGENREALAESVLERVKADHRFYSR